MRLKKCVIASAIAAAMVFLPVGNVSMALAATAVTTSAVVTASKVPTISDETVVILNGNKFNLNVNNKVKGSTYEWSTSNKKVATVNERGFVTGLKKGKVTITCVVKLDGKTTHTLKSKVTVREGAKSIELNNKVYALNLGQKYNLNRTLTPATSNDLTTLTSSDKTIANPKANGVFTALKEGEVTITATTLSGATDSVTLKVVDKDGTVKNQAELDAILGKGVNKITISTNEAVAIVIPEGEYLTTDLVINAANATIVNQGKFRSVVSGATVTPGTGGSGGYIPGPVTPVNPTNPIVDYEVKPIISNNVSAYSLPTSIDRLQEVVVKYGNVTYTVEEELLTTLTGFLTKKDASLKTWNNTTKTTKVYGGQTVVVEGVAGESEKKVSLLGKEYTVDVSSNGVVTVTTKANNVYEIRQSGGTITIKNAPTNLSFFVTSK